MAIFKKNKKLIATSPPEEEESPEELEEDEEDDDEEEPVKKRTTLPKLPKQEKIPEYKEIPVCLSHAQINNIIIENNIMLKQILSEMD